MIQYAPICKGLDIVVLVRGRLRLVDMIQFHTDYRMKNTGTLAVARIHMMV